MADIQNRNEKELTELTANEAAGAIKQGTLSAEQYAAHLLRRLNEHKELNVVAWIDEARVMEAARAIDQTRIQGGALGPLAGLPLIIKDNIETVGYPASAGTPSLKPYRPKKNAPVVEALLKSGAIVLAKANMHELALGGTSSNAAFGFVKNPYDRTRVPGGSSGGTAAAIAARIAPGGLGSDTAGSVRMPAAVCGIAGLRPTSGVFGKAYSTDGVVPLTLRFDTIGPMARTVADVALLDSAITGRPFPAIVPLRGTRVGIPRGFYWEDVDPQIIAVSEAAIACLREAGLEFVEIDMAGMVRDVTEAFWQISVEGSKDLSAFLEQNFPALSLEELVGQIASPDVRELFAATRNRKLAPEVIERAHALYASVSGQYESILRSAGLTAIVFPTMPMLPPPLGIPSNRVLVRNTVPSGMFGGPGLSVPAGMTADGLPVGIEFDGFPGADGQILGLGMAIEAVLGSLPTPRL